MVADGGAFTQSPADIRPEYPQFAHEQSMTQKPITRKPVPTSASTLLAPPTRSESPSNMSRYSASNYDNDSNDTPDYDSPPEDPNPSLLPRRRRTGVLRTVGDPSLGNTSDPPGQPSKIDIPAVDFGITYTPTLTPGHSRPATASGILDVPSTSKLPHTAPATPQARSPQDEKRISYIDSSSGLPSHSRSSSYAWQPGTVTGRQSPGGGLSAEEFVLLRAATARIPNGYVPHRSVSYSQLESPSKLQKKKDSPGRPSSRNSLLVDYSSHMTAREQEHVAKMTGGPLIQIGERSKTPDPSIGLIGAIEAREQEKRNMKQGVAGHMVKEAIAQRQAAERNYGNQQYPQYGYAMDSRQSGQGIYPQSPSPSPSSQMHQAWTDQQLYQYQSPSQMQRRQSQMDRSRLSGYYSSPGGYGTR